MNPGERERDVRMTDRTNENECRVFCTADRKTRHFCARWVTSCCCLFWTTKCNYLSALAAVGLINELYSQLETVQYEFCECGMSTCRAFVLFTCAQTTKVSQICTFRLWAEFWVALDLYCKIQLKYNTPKVTQSYTQHYHFSVVLGFHTDSLFRILELLTYKVCAENTFPPTQFQIKTQCSSPCELGGLKLVKL